jgi:hypothetical protein
MGCEMPTDEEFKEDTKIERLEYLFKSYIEILRAIDKSNQKAEVFDLEMYLDNVRDDILKEINGEEY